MGELIWNKYTRTAIPEYLFYFNSGGKKELKDRSAISIPPFLFFFFSVFGSVPMCSYLPYGPSSMATDYPQTQFRIPLSGKCLDSLSHLLSSLCHGTAITAHTGLFSPTHTVTWDFKIQCSIILGTILHPNNSANPMRKHYLKLLTLPERSLFLCKLPSVWESAYMPSVTKTLGQS